jgi:importin subunit beta-1
MQCPFDPLLTLNVLTFCDRLLLKKYLSALAPFLVMGLQNFQAHHVCAIAVGLVGNIARSVEGKIQPYCNEIMTALVESLQNPDLHRSVKTSVLSSFGDIAMALKGNFEPYLKVSMIMLMQASQTPMPEDDEEIIDFINKLREGVLEAFTGIIQGMYDGERTYLIHVYVAPIMQFLQVLSAEENKDYEVLSKAAGLLG